jgi:hypothetical protein
MIPARSIAVLCIALLIAFNPYAIAQDPQPPLTPVRQSETLLTPDELDSLVAPVALYPDPVLSQVLVASTYPVDIVEAARWLDENKHMSSKELVAAAAEKPWDASVQALIMLPDVLHRLYSEMRWTTDLGNAFMAQEEEVMDAIQRMRQKASAAGALRSTPQQTVKTVTENNQPFIIIEPASPQVVYVPVYNPVAVWGTPVVPFPVISYPPYRGIAAASALSFGAGMAVGSFWGGGWGGWGWSPGWGRRTVIVNNNFIRSNRFNRANVGAGNRWVRSNRPGRGRPNLGASNRPNNNRGNNLRGGNRGRPTAEQTRRRLEARGGGAGRPSQAQRGGRGSAARRQGGASEGQRARRGNAQGGANRIQQGRPQGRENRGGNRQANRGSANRQANRGSANRGSANRAVSRGGNRGGGRSAGARNRGSANRGSANRAASRGGNRGGGRSGGARNRGSANRSAGGGGRGGGAARGGGGSRGGGRRR